MILKILALIAIATTITIICWLVVRKIDM